MTEVCCHPSIPDHQVGPVEVAVESNLCAIAPLTPDLPQYGGSVLLIERIARVNDEEPPNPSPSPAIAAAR